MASMAVTPWAMALSRGLRILHQRVRVARECQYAEAVVMPRLAWPPLWVHGLRLADAA
jgi:hypothetical protein